MGLSQEKGYAIVYDWKPGDMISLDMDMPVEVESADPLVTENIGKRAIQRGPLVYCAEETDNSAYFDRLTLTSDTEYHTSFEAGLLNGVKTINAKNEQQSITFIPYYAWDNREAGKMKVWIDYKE